MSLETGAVLTVQEGLRVPGGRATFEADLTRLAQALARSARRPVWLGVALVDDAVIRVTNAEHLDHDWATDVISFPMAEAPRIEGELMISADTARREASERGHSPYHELMLYAVHGGLHLLGYDDHNASDRRRMRAAERRVLARLGLPAVFGRGRASPGA